MLQTVQEDIAASAHPEAGQRAIVIGGGFGGIAASLRLRAKGYHVTLIERAARLGGRAQVFEKDGFRYDAGPTVITAQFLFEELFALFGRRMDDYVRLVPLNPWYRFHYPDGSTFDYGGTLDETLAEIRRLSPADADGYMHLLAHSEKLFNAGFLGLADQPFHNPLTMLRQAPKLVRLRSYETVWQMVCRFLKHDKLRQAFSIQPLLVGGSPFETTSIYGLIHYLERKWGVWFAMGGTGAMVAALGRLMQEVGVDVRTGQTVARIRMEGRKATGVVLENGAVLPAQVIVSNADPMHLFKNMVPREALPASVKLKMGTARLSMGLFLLYFGTRRQYPEIAHHTIWLGGRFRELLSDIFKHGRLADDFSLYVHRPTATDPSFAPAGCDSFYALCPVPNLTSEIDWYAEAPRLRDRIVTALERTILPGLSQHITAEMMFTPADFAQNYLSYRGTGFSIAPHFTQSAWFRFHNRAEGIEGLYLTGAGTHPGAGMPGVLCSAKVIDRLIPEAAKPFNSPAWALSSAART
jgi:phytoene desaturase